MREGTVCISSPRPAFASSLRKLELVVQRSKAKVVIGNVLLSSYCKARDCGQNRTKTQPLPYANEGPRYLRTTSSRKGDVDARRGHNRCRSRGSEGRTRMELSPSAENVKAGRGKGSRTPAQVVNAGGTRDVAASYWPSAKCAPSLATLNSQEMATGLEEKAKDLLLKWRRPPKHFFLVLRIQHTCLSSNPASPSIDSLSSPGMLR